MTIRVADSAPNEPVDYSSAHTPPNYVCKICGRGGIKLWRETNTFQVGATLRCADCAASERDLDISSMNAEGGCSNGLYETDQIGDLLPAVPAEDGFTYYWAYTHVPAAGVAWWQGLPNR